MAKVELKQPIVKEVADLLDGAKSAVLVNYRGITVEEDTKLRKELREAGVTYKVYKNTLVKLAVKDTPFEGLTEDLKGPLAIAVSKEDATAPARIINGYCKDIAALSLKAGVVDGTYYDEKGITIIATIPGREVLLSRLLGSFQAPITNFARVIKQIAEKDGEPVEEKEEAPEAEVKEEVTAAAPEEAATEEPAEA